MKKIKFDKRIIAGLIVFSAVQIFVSWQNQDPVSDKLDKIESMDTFVPLGYTLVPIQIENQAELGSLIDSFAVVDLHKKGINEIIESGVRLLRSPRNPDVFAVLVEQERARELISRFGATFTVSLKNPESGPKKPTPQRTIIKE